MISKAKSLSWRRQPRKLSKLSIRAARGSLLVSFNESKNVGSEEDVTSFHSTSDILGSATTLQFEESLDPIHNCKQHKRSHSLPSIGSDSFNNLHDLNLNEANKDIEDDNITQNQKRINTKLIEHQQISFKTIEKSNEAIQQLEARVENTRAEMMNNHVEIIKTIQNLQTHLSESVLESFAKLRKDISNLEEKISELQIQRKKHSSASSSFQDFLPDEAATSTKRKQSLVNSFLGKRDNKFKSNMKRKIEQKRGALIASFANSNHKIQNIPKDETIKLLLNQQIHSNVAFHTCSEEELIQINKAFGPEIYQAGNVIIQQGDDADRFFILEQGVLDVLQDGEHVEALKAPASFGEIALLFGSSYHVTVCARSDDCRLWSLRQQDYRTITSQYKLKRMQFKINFLKKVKIGEKVLGEVLRDADIDDMALATRHETFYRGDEIVKEGEKGNVFYMIEEGTVNVYKREAGAKPLVTLTNGNFFGEKALLNDEDVRQATCVATSKTVNCLFLMREDFVRMFGSLQDLLDKCWQEQEQDHPRYLNQGKKEEKPIRPEINVKLEDLEVVRVLGTGAFSTVKFVKLKARKRKSLLLNQRHIPKGFALKCLTNNPDFNVDFDSLIENEKKIMMEVSDAAVDTCPFIVHFYCEIRDSDHPYFLLEACLGGDLFNVLRSKSKFPEEWSRFYAASVLCAFDVIHSLRIAYRDLKPENLIMDSDGFIKIIDFGLAKKITGGKSWTLCGTLDYLSPEVILNEGHDWAVDYWALGVLAFEMTAGFCPFTNNDQFSMYQKILSGRIDIPSRFSRVLGDLIKALCRKDPTKRLGKTKGGAKTVKRHKWFVGFDFDALVKKDVRAPFVPTVQGDEFSLALEASLMSQNSEASLDLSTVPEKQIEAKAERSYKKEDFFRLSNISETNEALEKSRDLVSKSASVRSLKEVQATFSQKSVELNNTSEKDSARLDNNVKLTSLDKSIPVCNTNSENSVFEQGIDMKNHQNIPTLLCSSLTTVEANEADRSFNSFLLYSVDLEKLDPNKLSAGNGTNFLDPFVLKQVDRMDQFPPLESGNIVNDDVSALCHPNGISVRFIPRIALKKAYEQNWIGKGADKYQLHVFTDVTGARTYGISITVKEAVELQSKKFQPIREKRKAVAKIASWWTRLKSKNRSESEAPTSILRDRIRQSFRGQIGLSSDLAMYRKKSLIALSSMISNFGQEYTVAPRSSFTGKEKPIAMEYRRSRSEGSLIIAAKKVKNMTIASKRKATISYGNMMVNQRQGEVCIIEKCYILIGIKRDEESLLFNALQGLIDFEREKKSVKKFFKSDHEYNRTVRYTSLSEIQSLYLSLEQLQMKHPLRIINGGEEKDPTNFTHEFPSNRFPKICLPLPLPKVTKEWGIALLVLRMDMSRLLILLKLLLLERSVLVTGTSYEEVSSCTCSILELLNPFKWASVFMPLLPDGMLDFVSSPVPFIAGVVCSTNEKLETLEHDHRVKNSITSGLSVLNISTGKLSITEEDGVRNIVSNCSSTVRIWDKEHKLNHLQKRLKELVMETSSNIDSLQSFVMYGLSLKEAITLKSIRDGIYEHLSCLPSALVNGLNEWRHFGIYNEETFEFNFHPTWYIEAVRYQQQFEESLAQTQLFLGFIEERKNGDIMEKDPNKIDKAFIIAKWIEKNWKSKKKNKFQCMEISWNPKSTLLERSL